MKDQSIIFTLNFSCRFFRDYFDKSDIYYVTIAMMFFHAEVHLVFCWCLHNTVIIIVYSIGKDPHHYCTLKTDVTFNVSNI